jgi:hypothetical protein
MSFTERLNGLALGETPEILNGRPEGAVVRFGCLDETTHHSTRRTSFCVKMGKARFMLESDI